METKISLAEMKSAISESGYLIEQRVEQILRKNGYHVDTNDVYQDDETGKTREIDMTALAGKFVFDKDEHIIFPYLIIECENNKQPIVFFKSKSPIEFLFHEEVKLSGMPHQIFKNDNGLNVKLNDLLNFGEFHHYCKGFFSTQYCSFQQPKGDPKKWLALHQESQHNSFQNIIKCLKFKINDHLSSYILPADGAKEFMNIQIYYPLLILQGDMYEAYIEKNDVTLKSLNHVQFRKQIIKSGETETFQIDVIKESYLRKYLLIIDKESDEIVKRLKRKRKLLEESINIIVNRMKSSSLIG